MPVNYHQIESKLPEYGKRMKDYETALTQAEQALWEQFTRLDEDVAAAACQNRKSRSSAAPFVLRQTVSEPLLTHKTAPLPPAGYTLIAADGSQIVPNRHRPVQFGVINVKRFRRVWAAVIRLRSACPEHFARSGGAPQLKAT